MVCEMADTRSVGWPAVKDLLPFAQISSHEDLGLPCGMRTGPLE